MSTNKEKILIDCPNVISYECSKKIIEQMEKNICKITIETETEQKSQGTGFFCKIPFPNKNNMLPVFITNNHNINEDILNQENKKIQLDIKEEENIKEIILNENRKKYTNEEYDITIIEIKEEDNINNYLELDDIIINDILNDTNKNKEYIDETMYIIQYPENKLSVSYGILKSICQDKNYNFYHKCSTKKGSSGSPILSLNNKLIGIHKEWDKKYNVGTFLNFPIKKFIELNNEELLKEFNNKYHLNIKDTKISELELRNWKIDNKLLDELSKINFKELTKLNLGHIKISDIKILENIKFNKLKILNLSENEISDINILEKLNFKGLKELNLRENKIKDIKILEKVNFNNLEILDLGHNQISDISILEKVKFEELKTIYLDNNEISDIKVFEKVKFNKLEILNLGKNKISAIRVLEKV